MIDRTERETYQKAFRNLRHIGALILIIPAALVWRAYVATILWQWFLVETYGAQAVPLAGMVGLMVLLCAIRGARMEPKRAPDAPEHGPLAIFTFSAIGPAACLLVGWIARHWVVVAA